MEILKRLKGLLEYVYFLFFATVILVIIFFAMKYRDNASNLFTPSSEESIESMDSIESGDSIESKDSLQADASISPNDTETDESKALEQLYEMYGIPKDGSADEKQDAINSVLADRSKYIKIDTSINMTEDDEHCTLNIGNDPENDVDYVISIVRDDNNEEIYHSGLLSPGYYIGVTRMDTTFKEGNYRCTVFFITYEPETQIKIGQIVKKMDIIVNKASEE